MNHAGTMTPASYSPEASRVASSGPSYSLAWRVWCLPNLAGALPKVLSPQAVVGGARQEGLGNYFKPCDLLQNSKSSTKDYSEWEEKQ